MEEIVKRVLWIDKNINSKENQIILEKLKKGIQNAKFYLVESIDEAFDLIRNKKEEIIDKNGNKKKSKVFQYRLFYTIINDSFSNEFFTEYIKATKELTIISANIIICNDDTDYKFNEYYLDDFLNPGKAYNRQSIDKIIDYINKDETFLDNGILMGTKKVYKPLERNFGNVFFNANNISDIAYPFFFGQILNSTLISEYDLEDFQRFLLDYYPDLKFLIIPSREKKISIPYYLLAKFYIYMYTCEQCNFFKNMNLDLTNGKFDIYRIYIFLLYDALNKKSIKPYYTKSLYRGTVLSKKEYDDLETIFQYNKELNKNKDIKKEINTCLYNCKMFLSFSKSLAIATRFISAGNKDLIPVLFEVEGLDEKDMENSDFFISNLDLENISEFNDEKEVLFLPFSCFEIISIKDEIIENYGEKINVKRITLNYLLKYKKNLYKYIEEIKEKDKFEKFLKEVINSTFSNEISELINFKDSNVGKKIENFIIQKFYDGLQYLNEHKLLALISSSLFLFMSGTVITLAAGYGIIKLRDYFNNKKEKKDNLKLFCHSLFYEYLPKRYRDNYIPTLTWEGASKDAKSFAIELIEDGQRKWLIINIINCFRIISNDNYFDIGETLVDYRGISKNPYKASFILYELKEDNLKPKDWGIGENVEKDYNKKLSNYITQIAILNVF